MNADFGSLIGTCRSFPFHRVDDGDACRFLAGTYTLSFIGGSNSVTFSTSLHHSNIKLVVGSSTDSEYWNISEYYDSPAHFAETVINALLAGSLYINLFSTDKANIFALPLSYRADVYDVYRTDYSHETLISYKIASRKKRRGLPNKFVLF